MDNKKSVYYIVSGSILETRNKDSKFIGLEAGCKYRIQKYLFNALNI